jgi:hypothetical protein
MWNCKGFKESYVKLSIYLELQKLRRKRSKISNVSGKVQTVKEDSEFNSVTRSANAVIKGDFNNESKNGYEEKYAKLSIGLEM